MNIKTMTIQEMIENNVNIFDFPYPYYSEERRKTFEQNFIDYFYFSEIGVETVAKFKHILKVKLNLIMPYWNKILVADELEQRILDNYDVTETYERDVKSIVNAVNKNENINLENNLPKKKVDINSNDYISNITKDTNKGENNQVGDTSEKWTRKMQGNIGVQTDSDAIVKYWQSLRQIELEIFEQCSDLFMEVY